MSLRHLVTFATLATILVSGCAAPATPGPDEPGHPMEPTHRHVPGMTHANQTTGATPTDGAPGEVGQGAFAAIQEVVALLEEDPGTDWGRVDINALREHLLDMDRVTLDSTVTQWDLPAGVRLDVTGPGGAREAVRRMVAAHAQSVHGTNGWQVTWSEIPDGVRIDVEAPDPGEARHVQALGFFGFLATGAHHQAHHLAIAKGDTHVHDP